MVLDIHLSQRNIGNVLVYRPNVLHAWDRARVSTSPRAFLGTVGVSLSFHYLRCNFDVLFDLDMFHVRRLSGRGRGGGRGGAGIGESKISDGFEISVASEFTRAGGWCCGGSAEDSAILLLHPVLAHVVEGGLEIVQDDRVAKTLEDEGNLDENC